MTVEELKVVITAETDKIKSEVKEVKDSVGGLSETAENTNHRMSGAFAAIGTAVAAAFTVDKIKDFTNACLDAYSVQQEAETKLTEVMRTRMGATDEEIQSVFDLTSAQQGLGVVGDEVALSGAQQLATFLDNTDALNALIPSMEDLAVQQNGVNVSSGNMTSIANMMGKALQGNVGALTKVGITLSDEQAELIKTGDEMTKASVLSQVITDNVGHMNQAFAATDAGKIQQAKNTMGDLQETIGKKLQPAISKCYEIAADVMTKITPHILNIIDKVGQVVDWCTKHKDLMTVLAIVIGTVTVAIAAYNIAMNLTAIVTGIATGVAGAFGAVMAFITSPITLVVLAIGAVIAIGYLLITHWEEVKQIASDVWTWIQEKFQQFSDFLTGVFSTDWTESFGVFGNILNGFFANVGNIFEDVKAIFSGVIDFVTCIFKGDWEGAWNAIVDVFGGIFGLIGDIACAPINAVIGLLNGAIDLINMISIDIPDWVPIFGGSHFGIDIPKIPYLENGSIAEAGKQYFLEGTGDEAVIPLRDNDSAIDKIANRMLKGVNQDTSGNSNGKPVTVVLNMDGHKLGQVVIDNINQITEQNGRVPLTI